MLAVLFMAAATPLSAWLSDRFGRKPVLLLGSLAAIASGFAMEPLLARARRSASPCSSASSCS
ncbi:MFS transporter [Pseudomonas aeruginosa]|nr:MFS transporter [Pseudomonas aeruginosa]